MKKHLQGRYGPLFGTLLALLCLSAPGSASTIEAVLLGTNAGGYVDSYITDSTTGTQGRQRVFGGLLEWERVGGDFAGDLLPGLDDRFLSFCLEPQQYVRIGKTGEWTLRPVAAGANNIGGLGLLRARQIAQLLFHVYPVFGANPLSGREALALQVGLWEIVRETAAGAYSVTGGNTYFANPSVSNALGLAQDWLDDYVNTGSGGPALTDLRAITDPDRQDQLVQIHQQPLVPLQQVPVPGSLWLLLPPLLLLFRRSPGPAAAPRPPAPR